jgi:hypothetical protein
VHLVEDAFFADCADDGAELPAREVGLSAHAFNFTDDAIDGGVGGAVVHDDDQG